MTSLRDGFLALSPEKIARLIDEELQRAYDAAVSATIQEMVQPENQRLVLTPAQLENQRLVLTPAQPENKRLVLTPAQPEKQRLILKANPDWRKEHENNRCFLTPAKRKRLDPIAQTEDNENPRVVFLKESKAKSWHIL